MSQQLEAFLDGSLTPEQDRLFQQRLANDLELRDALATQQRISESLRRTLSAPSRPAFDVLNPPMHGATRNGVGHAEPALPPLRFPTAQPSRRLWIRRLAAAALLALSCGALWIAWSYVRPAGINLITPEEFYGRKVRNFVPYWKCEKAEEFAGAFRDRFGQPLMLKAMPADVAAAGIDYAHTLSDKTLAVLMTVGDQRVIVLVDRLSAGSASVPQSKDSSLHINRRVIGGLVLYEVSTLDQAHDGVLNYFFDPADEHPAEINTRWK